MDNYELDDVDRQLLSLLQENARYTGIELAEAVGVSDNTIHNRIDRLEEAGVVEGYAADVDHDRVGVELYFEFTCTTRIRDRTDVAEAALELPQVVEVTELMTGEHNLHIKALGAVDEDITYIAEQLDDLALEINDENLVRRERRPAMDFEALGDVLTDEG